jgi:hypothetical protein
MLPKDEMTRKSTDTYGQYERQRVTNTVVPEKSRALPLYHDPLIVEVLSHQPVVIL